MPQLGLVALLVAELVYLTVRFDSQALDRASSPWLHLVAWSPQYLRLAITVAVTALVLKTWRLAGPSAARAPASPSARIAWLAVHVAALLLFVRTTATVFDPALADRNAGMWVAAWFVLGAATLAAWALALWPRRISWLESKSVRAFAGVAAALGGAACLSGYVAEALWQPLARTTFRVVGAMLGVIYPQVVSQPEHLRLGTPGFAVRIAPECSGYEGIGLLLAFLAIYLWVYRRELRFPTALVLLPIGAVVMWVVNALRIVALIAIGTAGWRNIALGGFHSQAGWIAFNAIALSFVVLLNRGGYFRNEAAVSAAAHQDDATPAYLVPFLVVVACAMITGAFSAGIDWLYPVRVVAAAWMLWLFRRSYAHLGWTISWRAIAIGCVTFAIWIALVPSGPAGEPLPAALQSVPFAWAAAWLALRIVGYTVTVPLVEELAFRGYLTRRLMRSDFEHLPLGLFSWWSFVVSSLLFGALHGGLWLAGTIAGMTFALALYQRRAIGDAVVAHATTNGLIAMYVLTTGRWSMWG
jgi:exosortase E/protease (VPEID-CTERM system)